MKYNICALRGRDRDNPSFRGCSNARFWQRFEIRRGGIVILSHLLAKIICYG